MWICFSGCVTDFVRNDLSHQVVQATVIVWSLCYSFPIHVDWCVMRNEENKREDCSQHVSLSWNVSFDIRWLEGKKPQIRGVCRWINVCELSNNSPLACSRTFDLTHFAADVCVCVCVRASQSPGRWEIWWRGGSIWFQSMPGTNRNSHHYLKKRWSVSHSQGDTIPPSDSLIKTPLDENFMEREIACVRQAQLPVQWFHLPQQNIWGPEQPTLFLLFSFR